MLLLLIMLLLVLDGEHIHTRCRHEHWTEMAHVLGLAHNILRDAKDDTVAYHLSSRVLLRMSLSRHHLLRSGLLRLPKSIVCRVLLINGGYIIGRAQDVK